jgi:hypothetical protein
MMVHSDYHWWFWPWSPCFSSILIYIVYLIHSCFLVNQGSPLQQLPFALEFCGPMSYNCQIYCTCGAANCKFINEEFHRWNSGLDFSLGKDPDCSKGQIWLTKSIKNHLEPTPHWYFLSKKKKKKETHLIGSFISEFWNINRDIHLMSNGTSRECFTRFTKYLLTFTTWWGRQCFRNWEMRSRVL